MVSRAAPRMNHIAFLIQFDELRSPHAAVDPVVFPAGFIGVRFRRTIQEPDVIVLIDENTSHLLHAPPIGQGLRPERIHLEHWCTIVIDSLPLPLLRAPDGTGGENQNATNGKDGRVYAASPLPNIHGNSLLSPGASGPAPRISRMNAVCNVPGPYPNPSIRGVGAPMDGLSALPWTARWCQGTLPCEAIISQHKWCSALRYTCIAHAYTVLLLRP